jgi:hypothetical protein
MWSMPTGAPVNEKVLNPVASAPEASQLILFSPTPNAARLSGVESEAQALHPYLAAPADLLCLFL